MDNRQPPYSAGGNEVSAGVGMAASFGSQPQQHHHQQQQLEFLLAEQQQHRHQHQQQQQRAALHAASAPHEQRHNFPPTMLPQHGGGNMNNPITMRHDATSLSNMTAGNNNRSDAESAAAIQSMLLSSSNLSTQPNSLPYLRQFEPMNQSSTTSSLLQQQQQHQDQADLLARYQSQQRLLSQQQHFRNQQHQIQMLEARNNPNRLHGTATQMGHPSNSFQEMMLLQQQQQQGRGDDSLYNTNTFASLAGYGGGSSSTNLARSQQQQRLQHQSDLLQQQLSTTNHQQQQLLMMNDSLFPDPIEQLYQQQLQIEQQLRRRSSMSTGTASISPRLGSLDHQQQQMAAGVRSHLSLGSAVSNPTSNAPLFGTGMAGARTDFSRFSNTAPLLQQQSLLTSFTNQPQFKNNSDVNIGNRSTAPLSSSALLLRDEMESAGIALVRPDKKKRSRTFPEKLMAAMMEHEDERAVAWLPDGKSFVIVNPDLFVNEVLRGDFKQAKYASFVRKLHRWGFTRLTSGTGTDCFHHPQFNRNFPDWSVRITCVPMKEAAREPIVRAAPKSRSTKPLAAKEGDVTSDTKVAGPGIMEKPPSLAGVQRFIRGKTLDADTTLQYDPSSSVPNQDVTDPYIPVPSKHTDATAGRRLELLPIETTGTTREDMHQETEGEHTSARATI